MKFLLKFTTTLIVLGVSDGAPAALPDHITNLATMSCGDFLTYDDVAKPGFIYWVDGYSRTSPPEKTVLDIDRLNHLVPVLIEACGKDRRAPFLKKMMEALKTSA
jgi:hypothetical protein